MRLLPEVLWSYGGLWLLGVAGLAVVGVIGGADLARRRRRKAGSSDSPRRAGADLEPLRGDDYPVSQPPAMMPSGPSTLHPLARLQLCMDMQQRQRLLTTTPAIDHFPSSVQGRLRAISSTTTLPLYGRRRETVDVDRGATSPDLVVNVLGPIEVKGADRRLTTQQTALLAFLACVGPARKNVLIDALWSGKSISAGRFPNLVAETRSIVGRDRLQLDEHGRYTVAGVVTDLDHFKFLIAEAELAATVDERMSSMGRAFSLVRGRLFDRGSSKFWYWLDDQHELVAGAENTVIEAALSLTDAGLFGHDPELALRICRTALEAIPGDDRLLAIFKTQRWPALSQSPA